MLVLTFQKRQIANKIKERNYYVDLNKSNFSNSSFRFTLGYNKILKELRSKGITMAQNEGCIWGWVSNPSREIIKNYIHMGYIAMFIDIDESKCVMSDYDVFNSYVQKESNDSQFIVSYPKDNKHCIQCAFTIDAIYGVRGIYTLPSIIIYNSILRSFYANMTLEAVKYSNLLDSYSFFDVIRHNIRYRWNRFIFQMKSIKEPLLQMLCIHELSDYEIYERIS